MILRLLLIFSLSSIGSSFTPEIELDRCNADTVCYIRKSCVDGTSKNDMVRFKTGELENGSCDVVLQIKPHNDELLHIMLQVNIPNITNDGVALKQEVEQFRCALGGETTENPKFSIFTHGDRNQALHHFLFCSFLLKSTEYIPIIFRENEEIATIVYTSDQEHILNLGFVKGEFWSDILTAKSCDPDIVKSPDNHNQSHSFEKVDSTRDPITCSDRRILQIVRGNGDVEYPERLACNTQKKWEFVRQSESQTETVIIGKINRVQEKITVYCVAKTCSLCERLQTIECEGCEESIFNSIRGDCTTSTCSNGLWRISDGGGDPVEGEMNCDHKTGSLDHRQSAWYFTPKPVDPSTVPNPVEISKAACAIDAVCLLPNPDQLTTITRLDCPSRDGRVLNCDPVQEQGTKKDLYCNNSFQLRYQLFDKTASVAAASSFPTGTVVGVGVVLLIIVVVIGSIGGYHLKLKSNRAPVILFTMIFLLLIVSVCGGKDKKDKEGPGYRRDTVASAIKKRPKIPYIPRNYDPTPRNDEGGEEAHLDNQPNTPAAETTAIEGEMQIDETQWCPVRPDTPHPRRLTPDERARLPKEFDIDRDIYLRHDYNGLERGHYFWREDQVFHRATDSDVTTERTEWSMDRSFTMNVDLFGGVVGGSMQNVGASLAESESNLLFPDRMHSEENFLAPIETDRLDSSNEYMQDNLTILRGRYGDMIEDSVSPRSTLSIRSRNETIELSEVGGSDGPSIDDVTERMSTLSILSPVRTRSSADNATSHADRSILIRQMHDDLLDIDDGNFEFADPPLRERREDPNGLVPAEQQNPLSSPIVRAARIARFENIVPPTLNADSVLLRQQSANDRIANELRRDIQRAAEAQEQRAQRRLQVLIGRDEPDGIAQANQGVPRLVDPENAQFVLQRQIEYQRNTRILNRLREENQRVLEPHDPYLPLVDPVDPEDEMNIGVNIRDDEEEVREELDPAQRAEMRRAAAAAISRRQERNAQRSAPLRRPRPTDIGRQDEEVLAAQEREVRREERALAINRRLEAQGQRGMARSGQQERDRAARANRSTIGIGAVVIPETRNVAIQASAIRAENNANTADRQISTVSIPNVPPLSPLELIDAEIASIAEVMYQQLTRRENEPNEQDRFRPRTDRFREIITNRHELITGIPREEIAFLEGRIRSSIIVFENLSLRDVIYLRQTAPESVIYLETQGSNLFAQIRSIQEAFSIVVQSQHTHLRADFIRRSPTLHNTEDSNMYRGATFVIRFPLRQIGDFIGDVSRILGGNPASRQPCEIVTSFANIRRLLVAERLLHRTVLNGQEVSVSHM